MIRHPFLKLSVLAIAGGAVYSFVLNNDAKTAVRGAAITVYDKGKELLKELKIIKEDFTGNSVSNAQRWADEQWERAGF